MTIIQQISTHKAVINNGRIDIIAKGFELDGKVWAVDEKLYSIPMHCMDDVVSIMDRYEEDNRINLAELNNF